MGTHPKAVIDARNEQPACPLSELSAEVGAGWRACMQGKAAWGMINTGALCMAGRRWGQEDLYLHTYSDNAGAISLYKGRGYVLQGKRRRLSALWTGRTEHLYRKQLLQPGGRLLGRDSRDDGIAIGGAVRAADNVFIWERVDREREI